MTAPRHLAPQYEGDRIILMSGSVPIGAVFPPVGTPRDHLPWVWRIWAVSNTSGGFQTEGRAKTEQAAKNAILAAFQSWLDTAGLQVKQ